MGSLSSTLIILIVIVSATATVVNRGGDIARAGWKERQRLQQDGVQQILGPRPRSFSKWPDLPFPHRPSQHVSGFIAMGDSYSAGIGTGLNGSENECRQGLHAYPRLIHADYMRRSSSTDHVLPELQFLSCTGSTTGDLLSGSQHSQIDRLNVTLKPDFALLSIGGNDLGFFEIMNSCIFRFYSFYSGTCEEALQRSEESLQSDEFEQRLRLAIMEVLDRVEWEKRPWFTITVTGYARFFNELTDDCDNRSFGVWWRGPRLKRSLRQRMNRMVLSVNDKIRTSVHEINADFLNPRVFFVDYDDAFEGHRFCEHNITEPDYANNNTWFFLVGGIDNGQAHQGLRTPLAGNEALHLDSPLLDPRTCLHKAEKSRDWGELALCLMVKAKADDPSLQPSEDILAIQNSMWYVPTYYGKTFHPRTLGHEAIRDRIYKLWAQ